MDRSPRRPRAIAIAHPIARIRMTRDLAADWRRWSRAERFAAMLIAVLATAAWVTNIVLAAG